MALFANGGITGFKPCAASGASLFDALCWDFIARHEPVLTANAHGEVPRALARMDPSKLAAMLPA